MKLKISEKDSPSTPLKLNLKFWLLGKKNANFSNQKYLFLVEIAKYVRLQNLPAWTFYIRHSISESVRVIKLKISEKDCWVDILQGC